jgi:hypothetical protein
MSKPLVGLAAAAVLAAGLGAASFGLAAGTAHAEPHFLPAYHWCPGDDFRPEWGGNWEPNACHDDYHRDGDGYDHSRDYHGYDDRGRDYRDGNDHRDYGPPPPDYYGPPPGNYYVPPGYDGPPPPPGGWATPPFCIPFVNCPPT